jgi:hypothetical protein
MTTTTTYGNFCQRVNDGGGTITLHAYVEQAVDGWPGIDVDAVAKAFRAEINTALPDAVELCGDEFYGPAGYEVADWAADGYPVDEDGALDIGEIIEGVDFWAIVEEHDLADAATAEQLASAVYAAMTVDPKVYGSTPDGVQRIVMHNGWALRIAADTEVRNPHGISWWMDSPVERLVESDGWDILPTEQLGDAAAKLAAFFEQCAK